MDLEDRELEVIEEEKQDVEQMKQQKLFFIKTTKDIVKNMDSIKLQIVPLDIEIKRLKELCFKQRNSHNPTTCKFCIQVRKLKKQESETIEHLNDLKKQEREKKEEYDEAVNQRNIRFNYR